MAAKKKTQKLDLPMDLGNGWVLFHAQPEQTVVSGGAGTQVFTVKEGLYSAHKQLDDRAGEHLYTQSGNSLEQLKERIKYWEDSQFDPLVA